MELEACYRVLGVRSDADLTEIKSAFRRLVLEYHPDRNKSPGAEGKFNVITEAYGTIMGSHGVPLGTRFEGHNASSEVPSGGKVSFTIFADREIVISVSPKLFEGEIRKRFNPNLAAGTACKIGGRWFEIENDSSRGIPIIGSRLMKHRGLIEWYKTPKDLDQSKPVTWEGFWSFVRSFADSAIA